MPKDELDPDDPLELRGVGLLTGEDTSETMTECFIEEFLRLGFDAGQILSLFRNPHYTGTHMVLRSRGETFVKDKIAEVFGWWGRPVHGHRLSGSGRRLEADASSPGPGDTAEPSTDSPQGSNASSS